jgi:hypothetical protein
MDGLTLSEILLGRLLGPVAASDQSRELARPSLLPRLGTERCGLNPGPGHRGQPEVGHELRHQLELLVGDGQPGALLDVAGGA